MSPNYTFEERDSKSVEVLFKGDTRELTVSMTSNAEGALLPFQPIYGGKTSRSVTIAPTIQLEF